MLNRLKDAKGTAAEKYGHSHYYEQVHASGKPKSRGFYAMGAKGKWNFVKNMRRLPRRPLYTPLKECLEDTDKDLRKFISLDTQCYYPPGFAPATAPESPDSIDCKLDPNDTWSVPNGCMAPSCTTFETVDAWNVGSGKSEYGWALKVQVPEAIPSIGWTVAIRVPKQSRGTFESWNAAFYNVHEKDDEIVFIMHAKWFYTDSVERSSVIFVGSNLEKADLPKLLLYKGRQSGTTCFGNVSMRGNQNRLGLRGEEERNIPPKEYNAAFKEFNRVVIRDGEVIRAKGD